MVQSTVAEEAGNFFTKRSASTRASYREPECEGVEWLKGRHSTTMNTWAARRQETETMRKISPLQ